MSDSLSVNPEFLSVLATVQDNASSYLKSATETITGISAEVENTHGSYNSTFNTALATFETIHNAAGTGLQGLANQVATNLRAAAKAYSEADDALASTVDDINFSG